MQHSNCNSTLPLRFKHFSRKGYALFSCLGREVIIGTLSVATLSHARAEGISVNTEAVGDTLLRKELKLDEVVITGSRAPLTDIQSAKIVAVITRDDIQRAAAESINDILKLVPGVDVRQRGGFGVQTDISVRGGNFDQITILLNGINISSPHTGHLSADFPVSPEDIERIEVLEGPAARVYGTAAFNGVINIVTSVSANSHSKHPVAGYLNASGGQYGYANANGAVSYRETSLSLGYTRTDGATPNSDFSSTRAFFRTRLHAPGMRFDAQVGYSYKPYGANTFYGAASTDQWESNERLMVALKADAEVGSFHVSPQAYWNRWNDHYQWHRGVTPGGENFHQVDVYGVGVNSWHESILGRTAFGVEMRNEGIWSTKLGKPLSEKEQRPVSGIDANRDRNYLFSDQRTNLSAFLEHNILLEKWTISLGLLANMNTALDHKWRIYPGVDVAYRPTNAWKLYASWNMALRMPTFTDLYYGGNGIEGNSNLLPEKTSDVQLGTRYTAGSFTADVQLFYSHKTDMIDWVTYSPGNGAPSDGIFHSINFKRNNSGIEINATWQPRVLIGESFPLRSVSARYAYIHEDSAYPVDVLQSKYAMDYLRHRVILSADGRIWSKLNLSASWRWQDRTGTGNQSYGIVDGRLSWDSKRVSVYLDCTNILNKHYFDYISIPQPGRWMRAGVKYNF